MTVNAVTIVGPKGGARLSDSSGGAATAIFQIAQDGAKLSAGSGGGVGISASSGGGARLSAGSAGGARLSAGLVGGAKLSAGLGGRSMLSGSWSCTLLLH